jgi:hypothetical protein
MLIMKTYGHLRTEHSQEMAKRMTGNAPAPADYKEPASKPLRDAKSSASCLEPWLLPV